jgi:methyl halide transferase
MFFNISPIFTRKMSHQNLEDQYWTERYLQNKTGWDIGYPSTPLKAYIDQLTDKSVKILIPGCGNSYEAEYLLNAGFTNITLVDISALLVKNLKGKFINEKIRIIHMDFFNLDEQFDLILEQTFFCALEPSRRKDYVKKMSSLLSSKGKLVGVLFDKFFEGGPPFGGSAEEYRKLFSASLHIEKMEPCYNSIPPRAGSELFFIASLKN